VSEYQHIEFRAVDRPLNDAELSFARKQSTRAEISRWSFQNEYHYGDFHGDVNGLLQRGFDVHLHYANFGVRTVAFRLPAGLPFPKNLWPKHIGIGELSWKADRSGKAGILSLRPYREAGEIEELWDLGQYMDAVVEVRNQLLAGDPRALYLLWLCSVINDQEDLLDIAEPPVPAGLAESVDAFGPFLEFFGIDPLVLTATSEGSLDGPRTPSRERQMHQWVKALSNIDSKRLLEEFLTKDTAAIKAETIAAILSTGKTSDWPSETLDRSCQELLDRADQLRAEQNEKDRKKRVATEKRKAAKNERERQDRMKLMVNDPRSWLCKADKLVDARGVENYEAAAEILSDLREALKDEDGALFTRTHAAHLVKKHPTLNRLKSSLRKRRLLG